MKFARCDYDRRIIDKEGKIPKDEPCFLLRGQDRIAPKLLLQWAMDIRLHGGDVEMAKSVENHAQAMIEWQKIHGSKTPDMEKEFVSESKLPILVEIHEVISLIEAGEITNLNQIYTICEKYSPGCFLYLTSYDLVKGRLDKGVPLKDMILPGSWDIDKFEEGKIKLIIYSDLNKKSLVILHNSFPKI